MASSAPIKSQPSNPLAPIPSSMATPVKPSKSTGCQPSDLSIPTPAKTVQTRSRRLAMSVKEVKKVAEGLRRNKKDLSEIGRSDEDLLPAVVRKSSRSNTPDKLPEKYEILSEFFNSMESSIRLIRMKGSSPTFPNISASIQNLTDRRFTYDHLAQLKYILPEAIVVEKVLLRDEATCCMKPDLRVMLLVDAVGKKEESGHSDLRRVFRERLVNFSKDHTEGEDIPKDQLPHPFNQTEPSICTNDHSPSGQPSLDTFAHEQFAVASHMPRSFGRRFSQKLPIHDSQKTPLACYTKSLHIVKPPLGKKLLLSCPVRLPSSSKLVINEEEAKKLKSDKCEELQINEEEAKKLKSNKCEELQINEEEAKKLKSDKCEGELQAVDATPAKAVSTPARLMTTTPESRTPKRCRSTMDLNSPSMDFKSPSVGLNSPPPKKSTKRSARTQLFSSPTKVARKEDGKSPAKCSSADDVISFLPESLLQSVREKERKALEEKDAGVAEAKRRHKLLAGLPNIYDMILLIFQSLQRSALTKQELVHKLIANNSKIVDRVEVEEQLKLLLELVPEWISEKVISSGDVLCCVNKILSPEEMRRRLVEAV